MPKRTYQPSKSKLKKQTGFRKRNSTKKGKRTLKKRTLRGRKKISG